MKNEYFRETHYINDIALWDEQSWTVHSQALASTAEYSKYP